MNQRPAFAKLIETLKELASMYRDRANEGSGSQVADNEEQAESTEKTIAELQRLSNRPSKD